METKAITVKLENGKEENISVRTLRVSEYQRALAFDDADNEPGLLDLVCERPVGWSITLHPDSYEKIVQAVYELNRAFFARAARQNAKRSLAQALAAAGSGVIASAR